jgi:hypothetical protein
MSERAYRPDKSSLSVVSRLASSEDARRECSRVIASVDERIAELARVASPHGIALDLTLLSLTSLEAWFLESVQADPDRPERLDAVWYAVAHDVGLYVGETMVRAAPVYRWGLAEDPESQYFHRCVITGVPDTGGRMWEWDPGQTVGDLGHQKIAGFHLREPFIGPMVVELVEFGNATE